MSGQNNNTANVTATENPLADFAKNMIGCFH